MDANRERLQNALRQHQDGRLAEAEDGYREVLQRDPTNVDALHLLGMLCHEQGRRDEAADLLRAAIEQRPDEGLLHNGLGVIQLAQRQWSEAKAAFERAIGLGAPGPEPYDNLGIALKELGSLQAAEQAFEQACQQDPTYPRAPLHLAELALRQGNAWKAESSFRQALALDPQCYNATLGLCRLLLEQGRGEEAAGLLRNLGTLPEDGKAQFDLGVLHADLGQFDLARQHLMKSIEIEPTSPTAHDRLGQVLSSLNEPEAAIKHFRPATRLDPAPLRYRIHTAACLRELGRAHEAADLLQSVEAGAAGAPEYLLELARVRQALGEHDEAKRIVGALLANEPSHGQALMVLATLLEAKGEAEGLVRPCVDALHADPECGPAHLLLGLVLSSRLAPEQRAKLDLAERTELIDKALRHLRKAVGIQRSAETLSALGGALIRAERHPEAINTLEQSLSLNGDFAPAHQELGKACLEVGNVEAAIIHFRRAVELDPRSMEAQYELSRITRSAEPQTEVDRLRPLLGDQRLAPGPRSMAHFAIARWYERLGDFDTAFQHYQTANAIKQDRSDGRRRRVRSVAESGSDPFAELKRVFQPTFFDRRREWGNSSELPVFIVGMPRSGTTLVEQILSGHSAVHGAGELSDITDLTLSLPRRLVSNQRYPEAARELTEGMAASLTAEYLTQLQRRAESAIRVTDKMPTNFRHLGLIALLFPRARVVHVIRDPLDVCVSCMKQNLEWPYCDLQSVGSYYRRYEQLMRYWRGTLNLRILDVRYEELIADPETNGRRMIEFCGLPWEDACLDFTGRDRAVQTPSKWQVRQPIYTSSIGSWRAYEKHLGALRVALGLTSGES